MEVQLVNPAKCEIRSVIRFLHAKGTPPVDIHRQMTEVYGDKCMSVQHVRKWCREFSTGRKEVHDEEQSGRPSVLEAVIEMVKREALQNRRITARELLAGIPGSSYGTVKRALTKILGYHKCCARWVPRLLTSEHMEKRLDCARQFLEKYQEDKEELLDSIVTGDGTWVFHFTPETKQKSKQTPSAGKVMASDFGNVREYC
ncbi:histone-lysine N-methyltransferase SETMAR-like [Lycorma delicatula]|uniref:histone-lysine N-methyltransferase SETMAR-like n=1 Tax=Lycorma delicatula TaxID=130591 RepID=UPI003F512661